MTWLQETASPPLTHNMETMLKHCKGTGVNKSRLYAEGALAMSLLLAGHAEAHISQVQQASRPRVQCRTLSHVLRMALSSMLSSVRPLSNADFRNLAGGRRGGGQGQLL